MSGAIGALLGRSVGRSLERRYGKGGAVAIGGLMMMITSLLLGLVYLFLQPMLTEADLAPKQIHVSRFVVEDSSLTIWSGGLAYSARARLWRPGVADETFRRALEAARDVTIWVRSGHTRIFGLTAGSLQIAPAAGIQEYLRGRFWFRSIWMGFLVIGGVTALFGLWQRRNESRPPSNDPR